MAYLDGDGRWIYTPEEIAAMNGHPVPPGQPEYRTGVGSNGQPDVNGNAPVPTPSGPAQNNFRWGGNMPGKGQFQDIPYTGPSDWRGVPFYQTDTAGHPLSKYANLVDQYQAARAPLQSEIMANRWNFGGPDTPAVPRWTSNRTGILNSTPLPTPGNGTGGGTGPIPHIPGTPGGPPGPGTPPPIFTPVPGTGGNPAPPVYPNPAGGGTSGPPAPTAPPPPQPLPQTPPPPYTGPITPGPRPGGSPTPSLLGAQFPGITLGRTPVLGAAPGATPGLADPTGSPGINAAMHKLLGGGAQYPIPQGAGSMAYPTAQTGLLGRGQGQPLPSVAGYGNPQTLQDFYALNHNQRKAYMGANPNGLAAIINAKNQAERDSGLTAGKPTYSPFPDGFVGALGPLGLIGRQT